MITTQSVGHAAAVLHPDPDYVYAPRDMFYVHQVPNTPPGQAYNTTSAVVSTMYSMPHATYPNVYAMSPVYTVPYPMMINNTNDGAVYSTSRMLQ